MRKTKAIHPQHSAVLTRARYVPAPSRQPLQLACPDWLRPAEVVQPVAQLAAAFDGPPFGEPVAPAPQPASPPASQPSLVATWDYEAALDRLKARRQAAETQAQAEAMLAQARAQADAEAQAKAELLTLAVSEPAPLGTWTPSMVWSAVFGLTLGLGCLAGGAYLVWLIALAQAR